MIINTKPPEKEKRQRHEDKDPIITFKDGTVIVWSRFRNLTKKKLRAAKRAVDEGRENTLKAIIRSYRPN